MKTSKNYLFALGSFMIMFLSTQIGLAQTFSVNKSSSNVKIEGTSNIHDWEMTAEDFRGTMNAEIEDSKLVNISQLEFIVVAESLKSGKSGMDKNAYKALKTNKHNTINYKMNKVNKIACGSNGECKIATSGTLTIAGVSKPANLTFDANISNNKVVLTGNHDIKMTNFKVDPPTAMFGTITTGDEIKINFQTVFTK